ncbi:MAG: polyketide synthase PksN [Colwellia sp.]|jgi:polyketide synthase PksN
MEFKNIEKLVSSLKNKLIKKKIEQPVEKNIQNSEDSSRPDETQDLAIIGMSCRFPGADNYSQYWNNLLAGVNSVKEIPKERWDLEQFFHRPDSTENLDNINASTSKWCGSIDDIASFDNRFFNISPKEAKEMDPQQRFLLEQSLLCIEDSGFPISALQKAKTSVYAGVMYDDYLHDGLDKGIKIESFSGMGNCQCFLANRLSYYFGLTGPSASVNAACASSLIAINNAKHDLLSGDSEYALVAAVNLNIHPWKYISFGKYRMFSPDGQCKAFDATANGYVPGDGAGVILLQRLDKAIANNAVIHGVIKGVSVNHVGRSVSVTAPRVELQQSLVLAAQQDAGVKSNDISYIEAHGTGTSLGDPIEVEALTRAFRENIDDKKTVSSCHIGSVKTNIGHLEPAAGMAGLFKVLLMMKNKTLVETLHITNPNPVINFPQTPFELSLENQPWITDSGRLLAGVSSFGFGGSSGHMIVESYQEANNKENNKENKGSEPLVVEENQLNLPTLISAKSEKALIELLESWEKFSDKSQFETLKLSDISKNLLFGRDHYKYRWQTSVKSKEELKLALKNKKIITPKFNDELLSLAIDDLEWSGYEVVSALLTSAKALDKALEILEFIDQKNSTQFKQTFTSLEWPQEYRVAFSVLSGTLLTQHMLTHLPQPISFYGRNNGVWVMACQAKSLKLIEVTTYLLGIRSIDTVSVAWPSTPLIDARDGTLLSASSVQADYLKTLISKADIDKDSIDSLKNIAGLMEKHQYTFKNYLKEWDNILASYDINEYQQVLRSVIDGNDSKVNPKGSHTLAYIILVFCIEELNRKWNLTERKWQHDAYIGEILCWLQSHRIIKHELVEAFCQPTPDWEAWAKAINQRIIPIEIEKKFPFLQQWQQNHNVLVNPQWFVDLSKATVPFYATTTSGIINKTIVFCSTEIDEIVDSKNLTPLVLNDEELTIEHLLAQLWQHGLEVDWALLVAPAEVASVQFKRLRLPSTVFIKKKFWHSQVSIREQEKQRISTLKSLSPEILETEDKQVVPESVNVDINEATEKDDEITNRIEIVSDAQTTIAAHVITDRLLLPAAAYLSVVQQLATGLKATESIAVKNAMVLAASPLISGHKTALITSIDNDKVTVNIEDKAVFSAQIGLVQTSSEQAESRKKPSIPFASVQSLNNQTELYGLLAHRGYQYGSSLRCVNQLQSASEIQEYKISSNPELTLFERQVALFDGCLQSALLALYQSQPEAVADEYLLVPYIIGEMTLLPEESTEIFTRFSSAELEFKSGGYTTDIVMYDQNGNEQATLLQVVFRQVPKGFLGKDNQLPAHLYKPIWRKSSLNNKAASAEHQYVISNNAKVTGSLQNNGDETNWQVFNNPEQCLATARALTKDKSSKGDSFDIVIDLAVLSVNNTLIDSISDAVRSEQESIRGFFEFIKELKKACRRHELRILLLTENSLAVLEQDIPVNSYLASLIGFCNSASVELSKISFTYCDLQFDKTIDFKKLIEGELAPSKGVAIVAYRDGNRFTREIKLCANELLEDTDFNVSPFKDSATYMITGGLGGVGLQVAKMLCQRSEAQLVLVGRSALNEDKSSKLELLRQYGNQISYVIADLSDYDQVVELFNTFSKQTIAINGVIHCAGVVTDGLLLNKTWQTFAKVLQPKWDGTAYLQNAMLQQDKNIILDFFVSFSSIISMLGNHGQVDYGTANAYMDALSQSFYGKTDLSRFNKILSINWTLWSGEGMGDDQTIIDQFAAKGLPTITPSQGINALWNILSGPDHLGNISVLKLPYKNWLQPYNEGIQIKEKTMPIQKEIYQTEEQLISWISKIVASKTGDDVEDIDSQDSFFDLGVESLALQDIVAELGKSYDNLSATLLFDFTSIDKLAEHLATLVVTAKEVSHIEEPSEAAVQEKLAQVSQSEILTTLQPEVIVNDEAANNHSSNDNASSARLLNEGASHKKTEEINNPAQMAIAIIGISGQFPEADNIQQFWDNINAHKNSVTKVPAERWHVEDFTRPDGLQSYGKWGGFINDVDKFDPLFFSVTPKEAAQMDPQQRLFLQTTWHAMENAGYGDPKSYQNKKVGLYVGAMWNDYSLVTHDAGYTQDSYQGPGSIYWAIANRVSYIMDFKGPSLAVDTACSSSLISIDLACQSIMRGDCEMAVAGGTNLILHPSKYAYLSEARFLAEDGLCRSFGEGGSGYVPGEGVAALILKPLTQAEKDGDYIYGVIRGSAVNHGGKAAGFTVPNSEAHSELIKTAFQRAQVSPEKLGYIECHGTGTPLGDPIEVNGLVNAFKELAPDLKLSSIPIGSLKSNVGHLEACAGVAGMIKVLGSMQSKQLPKSLHSETLNKNIDFNQTPLYVLQENQSWLSDINKQCASISSFGAGGANAHIVLEAYANQQHGVTAGEWPILLSARTQTQLTNTISNLLEWLKTPFSNSFNLKDIACTLIHGRKHHAYRVGVMADTQEGLQASLQRILQDKNYEKTSREAARETTLHAGAGVDVIEPWIKGRMINWQSYFTAHPNELANDISVSYTKVPLPGYPFAKDSYWIGEFGQNAKPGESIKGRGVKLAASDVNKAKNASYRHRLSADDINIEGHYFNASVIVPGATLMAHVLSSYEDFSSTESHVLKDPVALKNIKWHQAIPLNNGQVADIEIVFSSASQGNAFSLSLTEQGREQSTALVMSGSIESTTRNLSSRLNPNVDPKNVQQWQNEAWLDHNAFYQHVHQKIDWPQAGDVSNDVSHNKGLRYENSFRRVAQLTHLSHLHQKNISMARAFVWQSSISSVEKNQALTIDPLVLDGCLQTVLGLVPDTSIKSVIPVSMGAIELMASLEGDCGVIVLAEKKIDQTTWSFDLEISDKQGKLIASIKQLLLQETQGTSPEKNHFFTPDWLNAPLPALQETAPLSSDRLVMLIGWPQMLGNKLVSALQQGQVINTAKIQLVTELNQRNGKTLFSEAKAQGFKKISVWRYQKEDSSFPDLVSDESQPIQAMKNNAKTNVELFKTIAFYDEDFQFDYLSVVHRLAAALPYQLAEYGLIRSLEKELDSSRMRLLELAQADEQTSDELITLVMNEATTLTEQSESSTTRIKYQNNQRFELNWVAKESAPVAGSVIPEVRANSCYLITGGAKGLGLLFGGHLSVQASNVDIVLCGRSPLKPEQETQINKLQKQNVRLHYFIADVCVQEDIAKLINYCQSLTTPLKGIIHSAGVLRDGLMMGQSKDDYEAVLSPKVQGALWLDHYSREIELDYLILFSSITAAIGNAGQTNYGYANSFLDEFSQVRNQRVKQGERQGHTLSINWPLWQSDNLLGGMSVSPAIENAIYDTLGMKSLSSTQGLACFGSLIAEGSNQILVSPGDKLKLLSVLNAGEQKVINKALGVTSESLTAKVSSVTATLAIAPVLDLDVVIEKLNTILAKCTGMNTNNIDADETFDNYGLDSVMIIKMTQVIENDLGQLPKTLFFKCQTTAELAGYLIESKPEKLIAWLPKPEVTQNPAVAPSDSHIGANSAVTEQKWSVEDQSPVINAKTEEIKSRDIAIIGLAAKFPEADTLDEFWTNLSQGRDSVTEIPQDRWDINGFYRKNDPKAAEQQSSKLTSYSKWGGFLNDVDKFDPLLFGISPREAELIDPQERLFLQSAWHTFEDAGYNKAAMKDLEVGVFSGIMWSHYQILGATEALKGNPVPTESNFASVSNRVSYVMDLKGPSLTVDTMCSSSSVAIHLACESINNGDCQMALAGGVNLSLHPFKYYKLCDSNFLADDGRCRSFGEGGRGYVPAEAVGSVLLKPLQDAERDGDHIYAIIKGTAINHSGKATGYTVPSPKGQTRVIKKALTKAGIDPATISYVETHGTGTALGDPIEVEGLTDAYQLPVTKEQTCAIGSIKSNIGHPEAAAGIAALTKVILQMQNKALVPSLHSSVLNQNIDFSQSPFYVQQKMQNWAVPSVDAKGQPGVRRAGINSFGAGGANAHLIIEEYQHQYQPVQFETEQLIVLSAKNQSTLISLAKLMLEKLLNCSTQAQYSLLNIAGSLMLGREPLEQRLAFTASNSEQAIEKLQTIISGNQPDNYWQANTYESNENKAKPDFINTLLTGSDLNQLAQLWVSGNRIDWSKLPTLAKFNRVSLPGYPFAKRRCWLTQIDVDLSEKLQPKKAVNNLVTSHSEHPLLKIKEDHYGTVRYGISYNELWPLVKDHNINSEVMVPGMVMLEMALAAASQEICQKYDVASLQQLFTVQDLIWMSPLVLSDAASQQDDLSLNMMWLTLDVFDGGFNFSLISESIQGNTIEHANGQLQINQKCLEGHSIPKSADEIEVIELDSLFTDFEKLSGIQVYQELNSQGMNYGLDYQSIINAIVENNLCLAQLEGRGFGKNCHWQPVLLDGMLQSCLLVVKSLHPDMKQALVPFTIREIALSLDMAEATQVLVVLTSDSGITHNGTNSRYVFDLYLLNENKQVVLEISDFVASVVNKGTGTSKISSNNESQQESNKLASVENKASDAICSITANRNVSSAPHNLIFSLQEQESSLSEDGLLTLQEVKGSLVNKTVLVIDGNEQLAQTLKTYPAFGQSSILWAKPVVEDEKPSYWQGKGHWLSENQCAFEASETGYTWLLSQLTVQGIHPDHVIFNICKDRSPKLFDKNNLSQSKPQGALSISQFSKAFAGQLSTKPTFGVVVVQQMKQQPNVFNMGLVGLARTINVEVEHLKIHVLTLETDSLPRPVASSRLALKLVNELTHHEKDADVVYRQGKRFIKALTIAHNKPQDKITKTLKVNANSIVLITGGAGGIGFYLAQQWLIRHGGQIILTGRTPINSSIEQQLNTLRQCGGKADYLTCDVTIQDDVNQCLAQIRQKYGAISGIIHSAGIKNDGLLAHKDLASMLPIIAVKQKGLINLDLASAEDPLQFFIGFSSIAACFGNAGQADYAYGNAFTDEYISYRNQLCHQGVRKGFSHAIAWPLWEDVGGMDVKEHIRQWMFDEWQLETLTKEQGAECFFHIIEQQIEYAMVFPGAIGSSLLAQRTVLNSDERPVLSQSEGDSISERNSKNIKDKPKTGADHNMESDNKQRSRNIYLDDLIDLISEKAANILKLSANDFNTRAPFEQYGLDSVLSIKLVRDLKESFPTILNTVLFEHTTISDLANYLMIEHSGEVTQLFGETQEISKTVQTANTQNSAFQSKISQQNGLSATTQKNINRELATTLVKATVAEFVKLEPIDIRDNEPFESIGVDSIIGMQIVRVLRKQFPDLDSTALFEYNTCKQLVDYLLSNTNHSAEKVTPIAEPKKQPPMSREIKTVKKVQVTKTKLTVKPDMTETIQVKAPKVTPFQNTVAAKHKRNSSDGIAIVGLSGQYANSEDVQEFWQQLYGGVNAITEFPKQRLGSSSLKSTRWGSFMDDSDKFDGPFFKIPMKEAELMDPQERIFLESAWLAMEDAGYTPESMSAYTTGVYVGVMWGQYQLFGTGNSEAEMLPLRTSLASIANRVSYICDFKGPSIALDNMCASSLYTTHLACMAINAGEIDCALVGGVNLTLHPHKYRVLEEKDLLSADGLTRSYGQDGDGYAPGEGVGSVLLKSLAQAEADGDHIYGVIEASVVNHNGCSKAFMTPDPKAITEVAQKALAKAGLNGSEVGVIEGHGTGSRLGDAIEVNALAKAYGQDQNKQLASVDEGIAISSLKSNFGHLESASGVAAISKVLLQLQHESIVPSLHSSQINENIELHRTPFYIPQNNVDWCATQTKRRYAGINTFSAGGANAHLIIGEHVQDVQRQPAIEQQHLFVLSAGEFDTLKAYAAKFCDYLGSHLQKEDKTDLSWLSADLSYTLRVGRVVQRERLAIVYGDLQQLSESIQRFIKNSAKRASGDIEFGRSVYQGCVTDQTSELLNSGDYTEHFLTLLSQNRELDLIAKFWVGGLLNRIPAFDEDSQCKRCALPVYPFMKETCQIPRVEPAKIAELEEQSASKKSSTTEATTTKNTANLDMVNSELEGSSIDSSNTIADESKNINFYLRQNFSEILGISFNRLKQVDRFDSLGLDSLNGVKIIRKLQSSYPSLSEIALFEYPSFSKLTQHLIDCHSVLKEVTAEAVTGNYGEAVQEPDNLMHTDLKSTQLKETDIDDELLSLLELVS